MLDFDQYIDIFLDESKDHLQNLNESILRLEESPDNLDIVNEIFRIAHTLKGMAGTMGFEIITKLTHKLENILDGVRSHKFDLNRDMIDILFEGLDILDLQIKSIEEDGKEKALDISDIINRLDILEKGGSLSENMSGQNSAISQSSTANSNEKDDLNLSKDDALALYHTAKAMMDEGYLIYKISVSLEEKCMLKSARAFIVFKNLEDAGEVIFSNPSSDDIESESFEGKFTVLFMTKESIDEIKPSVESVSEVETVEISNFNIDILENYEETQAKEEPQESEKVEEPKAQEEAKAPEAPKKAEAKTEAAHGPQKAKSAKTIRVDIDRLDNLMNLVSELIIVKTRLEDNQIFSKKQNMTEAVEYLERVTTELHDAVTKVRMVPIERVFNRFPRMVRDLSKDLGKNINLIMSGEETEVDRTVIDEIGDPLVHLLRNSADHGIESPEERVKKGKDKDGTINLIAYQDGNTVVIEVTDDGAGINTEKVKQKAVDRGILTQEQADELDVNKAAELIFAAGFSTADKISNVSGRGVGLDVVKTKIESLSGTVEVNTEKDKGSSFIIRLPLTLAIIQALLVIVGGEKYAIPLNSIKEITNIDTNNIRNIENKEIILYRDNPLELKRLSEILDCEDKQRKEGTVTVVIVRKGEKDIGLIIDSLIGQQEIVIKSLGPYLHFVKLIAGATILGNGGVALIIDTNEIFE
jgi:chemotaxis histidine kinase cheA